MQKNYKRIFYVLAILISVKSIKAQTTLEHEAPTLQVGLDGLNFTKGTLDAQLIMQMVAEKQSEVKLKIVQNMFLSKMENSGGAFYSFTDNVIRGVLTEKDPDVITKKILENTVNITFTYAFADYYVRQLQLTPLSATALTNFNTLAADPKYGFTAFTTAQVSNGLISVRDNSVSLATSNEHSYIDPDATELIALIVDMSSEAIRQNKTLKELGVMQVSYSQSYDFMNKYLELQEENPALFVVATYVYNDMVNNLNDFTNMIGLLNYHKNANSYRLNGKILVNNFAVPNAAYTGMSISTEIDSVVRDIDRAISYTQGQMYSSSDTSMKRKIQIDLQSLSDFNYYLRKASDFSVNHPLSPSSTNPQDLVTYSDIIYTLHSDIIPRLNKVIWDVRVFKDVNLLEDISRKIEAYYIADVTNKLNNPWISSNVENFIDILSRTYEFDKATTFSYSVKILADLEKVFPNDRIRDGLSFINTYIRDLVVIKKDDKKNEYVDFNIESFILKLNEVKPDKLRRGSLLFTVGTNTIWFDKSQIIEDGTTIKNFSFVSEKIGFKFKLRDKSFWQTRNPGESYEIGRSSYTKETTPVEPIISDWHFIIYGSGLLYNIVNTGTSKDFNAPLIGIGTGWTFFNALDLNFTLGAPIPKNGDFVKVRFNTPKGFYQMKFNNVYYGLSFDFPFIEYIQRVNQNRKDNQNKRILSKLI